MGALKLEEKWNGDAIKQVLMDLSLFKEFSSEDIDHIVNMGVGVFLHTGEVLLRQGEVNSDIYILLDGELEVLLNGNPIAVVAEPGSLLGEMSFVIEGPCSTSVYTKHDSVFFSINHKKLKSFIQSKSLDYQVSLYQSFSRGLVEKIRETNVGNEKNSDDAVTDTGANILIAKQSKKSLRDLGIALRGRGYSVDLISKEEELFEKGRNLKLYDMVIIGEEFLEFFSKYENRFLKEKFILITNSYEENPTLIYGDFSYINNVIYKSPENKEYNTQNISSTVFKAVSSDIFGLKRYLMKEAVLCSEVVKRSDERAKYLQEMANYFGHIGIRSTIIERCLSVGEEMLMNAIFDAPVDENGKSLYNHIERTNVVELKPLEEAKFTFASDGIVAALAIEDPFGALNKETLLQYVDHSYKKNDKSLNYGNKEKAGGGIGLYIMIEAADYTIFNIKEGFKTEVISLFFLDRKMACQFEGPAFNLFNA